MWRSRRSETRGVPATDLKAHETWPHFSLGLVCFPFLCFCVLCVFLSVYLDFVPGNWLWPPEGYPLRIKVEIYTYKCHTSPGLCITKQQRKKGDRKEKTKQISAYFGIDFGRDMCHIHTASIRIPKNKLLKRLCHAEGKIKEENERKILFSFCALCHPFIVAASSWSGGIPYFVWQLLSMPCSSACFGFGLLRVACGEYYDM